MKKHYVVFTGVGARIYTNPDKETQATFPEGAIVLIDPRRINVAGVPLEFWEPDVEHNEIHCSKKYKRSEPVLPPIPKVKRKFDWIYVQQIAIVVVLVELIELLVRHLSS